MPRAALAQLLARLDARGNLDHVDIAVHSRNLDLAAQRSRGETDRAARQQRGAFAFEHVVPLDMQEQVKVARRRAERPCLALSGQADARTVVDACRNVHLQALFGIDAAFAPAVLARGFNHFASAMTRRAGPLHHEEALLCADLSVTLAQIAAPCRSARRCPRTGRKDRTSAKLPTADFGVLAVEGIFQRDFHVIAQVCPAPRLLTATATTECAAENRLEDIADISEVPAAKSATGVSATALLEGSVAITVIGRPLLRIRQTGRKLR